MRRANRQCWLFLIMTLMLTVPTLADSVVWDGGDGLWTDPMWNGGFTAQEAFGRQDGTEDGHQIEIGGGSHVTYNAGPNGVSSDFRLNSGRGPTSATIKEGATLELLSEDTDPSGLWTEWDGDLILDSGTLKRTHAGTSATSGAIMFGSWNTAGLADHVISLSLTNGGRIENHGMVMFGAWNESGPGLQVAVTINGGDIDLTGGDTFVLNELAEENADLHFYYGTVNDTAEPKAEQYSINFIGPGSITVDHAGIRIHHIEANYEPTPWQNEPVTYEGLWSLGILQANGQSGLTGANFSDYFTTSGTLGADNYTVTSRLTNLTCDLNGDGAADAADAGLMFGNWGNSGVGDCHADNIVDAADAGQLFGEWTGDPSAMTQGNLAGAPVAYIPEPTGLVLQGIALAACGLVSRRSEDRRRFAVSS